MKERQRTINQRIAAVKNFCNETKYPQVHAIIDCFKASIITWILSLLLIDPLSFLENHVSVEFLSSENSSLVVKVASYCKNQWIFYENTNE